MSIGTALVTGASSGIGAVYAERLARRGYDLILVARDRTRLDVAAERIRGEAGVAVEVLAADLSNPADLARVADRLASDPGLDVLVNCAGLGPSGPALASLPESYGPMLALNVVAMQRLALAAAAAFASRGHGTIINLASVVALVPERFNGPYVATETFARAGADLSRLPPEMVMEAGDMVDAALAGLDAGETVTIPSLPAVEDWQAFEAARLTLAPNLSHKRPAARYGVL